MIAAVAALLVAAAPAELEWDVRVDLPIAVFLGGGWLISEYALKKPFAPRECRWCERNEIDDAARAVRAPLSQQDSAALTSDLLGIAATPIAMLGLDAVLTWAGGGTWREGLVDALLIVEAMVTSQAINQLVKFAHARERPRIAVLPPDQKPLADKPEDNNLSFFSGHASYTFSLVAATATIVRARGYRHWWVVLAVGLPMAATTALLRMVADKHYLSDVLMGAAVGALIGWGVPFFFHRPVKVGAVSAWLSPGPGGVAVEGRW